MIDFSDLETRPEDYAGSAPAKAKKERPTFPCQSCGGSGTYKGVRVHQEETRCFPCDGRGYFYTSEADRRKNRQAAANRKRSKLETAQDVFNTEFPGFIEVCRDMASWNDFARDLLSRYNQYGALSQGQVDAVYRMKAKADATRAAKEAERAAMNAVVDLSAIHAMFDKAAKSGLKKPVYRAEGLVLSLAKASSVNAGAIYVKRTSGEYLGKVTGKQFLATRDAKAEDKSTLDLIATNPSQVARDYGKRVGVCSCCGRELTDPASIESGIGPICATKWGF